MSRVATEPGTKPEAEAQIDRVRRFNRGYTRVLGLLERGLHQSPFSLAEVRVLYELAQRDGASASALAAELGLDGGYLSRILKKFESRGLIHRTPAPNDARQSAIALTDAGRDAFAALDRASHDQIAGLIGPLPVDRRTTLVQAMETIERVLGLVPEPRVPYILRPPRAGDMGWIVHRHGVLYRQEYGWDESFEALVAEIVAGFVKNFDARRERCWIAERNGAVAGSIFLVKESDRESKLRLLFVEPSARGLGIGGRLVEECIVFARECGYAKVTLWTNDVLVSARRIYEARGFRLVREEAHHSFGKDLVGQYWELAL